MKTKIRLDANGLANDFCCSKTFKRNFAGYTKKVTSERTNE